jgi:hypothetical protein
MSPRITKERAEEIKSFLDAGSLVALEVSSKFILDFIADRADYEAKIAEQAEEIERLKNVALIDWQTVADAVADSINNADGRVSPAQIEHAFMKAGIGVFGMPDDPSMAIIEVTKQRRELAALESERDALKAQRFAAQARLAESKPQDVSEAMVEAAARALYACEMARGEHCTAVLSEAMGKTITGANVEPFEEHAETTWRPDARAALEAALALPPSEAARDVLAERQRQIFEEGWSAEHDLDFNGSGKLARAAACYAAYRQDDPRPITWPWNPRWWKLNKRRNLVKAGALIIAEIERLDRLAAAEIAERANG